MASPKISAARGFTLIETLIVVGLLAIIGGFSIVVNLNDLRAGSFREERAAIVIALQKARSAALNNLNLSRHGVAIYPADRPDSYVIFQGDTYASRVVAEDEVLVADYVVDIEAGSPTEFVFDQLSAEAECDGDPCTDTVPLRITDPERGLSVDILVNEEGRISW